MSKPVTKTRLAGFRGATTAFELDLDPSKDMTMLFGENGSGKSTILDAIDVVRPPFRCVITHHSSSIPPASINDKGTHIRL